MEYYPATTKREIMPFAATWMDLEIVILSKSYKDKHHMILLICGILKKNGAYEVTKQKQSHGCKKQTYGYHGKGDE